MPMLAQEFSCELTDLRVVIDDQDVPVATCRRGL
jgi:hypothetical protein